MVDIRKILIIFVIGVLFAILSQAIVDAFYPPPEWEDFCRSPRPEPVMKYNTNCTQLDYSVCYDQGAMPSNYTYDDKGCVQEFQCSFCERDYDEEQKTYNLFVFLLSSILGLISIGIGLYLPTKSNPLNEWVATGFMLGGLLTLFIGTARYYADMGRFIRPVVLLAELIIVLYLAYKKLSNKK